MTPNSRNLVADATIAKYSELPQRVLNGAKIVVNDSLKNQLFGDSDPIGKEIMVGTLQMTVIGVYHTKAGFLKAMDGRGPDRPRAVVPMMTAWRRMPVWRSMLIMVKPRPGVTRDDAMDAVTSLMRGRRGLHPSQPNNFHLIGMERKKK